MEVTKLITNVSAKPLHDRAWCLGAGVGGGVGGTELPLSSVFILLDIILQHA